MADPYSVYDDIYELDYEDYTPTPSAREHFYNDPYEGYPQQSHPKQAYPQQAHPEQAYPQQARPKQAYPQQAHPKQAYPQQAHPEQAYPQQARPQQAYPKQARPEQAYSQQARPKQARAQQAYQAQSTYDDDPYARKTWHPVSRDCSAHDEKFHDTQHTARYGSSPPANEPEYSPRDRYRDRSPPSRMQYKRDRSHSPSPPQRYSERRFSKSGRSPPGRRRSPDHGYRRGGHDQSPPQSPSARRQQHSPDRWRRRRSSSQSEQEASKPAQSEPEPVPAWMQALADSGVIPKSFVSGTNRPPMLIRGHVPAMTPKTLTPAQAMPATTPNQPANPPPTTPEPPPTEAPDTQKPELSSGPLVPMETDLTVGPCKASIRLTRFMFDKYEGPVLPPVDPVTVTTVESASRHRGMVKIRFDVGMQCPIPRCQPGPSFLTRASYALHWVALHSDSIKQVKCRLCKHQSLSMWGHPLIHLAHVHGITVELDNLHIFMNKTKVHRNDYIFPRGFIYDIQDYIEEYNYLQTDNGTYSTFDSYLPVYVSFQPGMSCPVTLCPYNVRYDKFEDLIAHWNFVHQEDCEYYVCQHCLKQPLVPRYYMALRSSSMLVHMLKEHPYAMMEPLVQEMLLNPAYIPPGRHRFLLANQRHIQERSKWLKRCSCTEQRPKRQRTPFTDPINTCPTHSGPLVAEKQSQSAQAAVPKETEIITFSAGMVCPVEKCPTRQKRAYQLQGEFAMHWTRMHKPSRHYACMRCSHTIKYMQGMLETDSESNAAKYHYETEHKAHAAHWKMGYNLEYSPMVDPGHLRY